MSEVDTQFLRESAATLREKLTEVKSSLAYTAPELVATTERMIDLFEATTPLDRLRPEVIALARALMHDYTKDFEE